MYLCQYLFEFHGYENPREMFFKCVFSPSSSCYKLLHEHFLRYSKHQLLDTRYFEAANAYII
jgi:hypothetical protein